jgi:nitroimidazol reductase NimA-like FMN-containing flavoprotein (pyridoxamine 5'-phosphate oxidase superfamily)
VDEPILSKEQFPPHPKRLKAAIARLLESEPYAVLSTRKRTQPYASLMAYAAVPSLKVLAFATPITTRKFHFLEGAPEVALLIDSRASAKGMMEVEAVTATGRARRAAGAEARRLGRLLCARHPQLEAFTRSPSCAIYAVDIYRYFYCARFQEVSVWTPGKKP